MKDYLIRQLRIEEWEIWKNFRIQAMTHDTESFPSSLKEELEATDQQYQNLLNRNTVFGAFVKEHEKEPEKLVGTASFAPYTSEREKHRGFFFGMYVHHLYRGKGIASALVETILKIAEAKVNQLHLRVLNNNLGAVALYRKYGFEDFGIEPRAIKIGGNFYDEKIMVRFFSPPYPPSGQVGATHSLQEEEKEKRE